MKGIWDGCSFMGSRGWTPVGCGTKPQELETNMDVDSTETQRKNTKKMKSSQWKHNFKKFTYDDGGTCTHVPLWLRSWILLMMTGNIHPYPPLSLTTPWILPMTTGGHAPISHCDYAPWTKTERLLVVFVWKFWLSYSIVKFIAIWRTL